MTEPTQHDVVEAAERARVEAPEVSWALREVTRASAEVDHALAEVMRLRPIEYAALGHVMSSAAALGPAELAARLGISSGSGTELVDRLEQAGHLRRERHPSDRRRLALHATDGAVGQVLGALAPLFTRLDEAAAELDPAEQQVVDRYLRGVARRMRSFAADVGSEVR